MNFESRFSHHAFTWHIQALLLDLLRNCFFYVIQMTLQSSLGVWLELKQQTTNEDLPFQIILLFCKAGAGPKSEGLAFQQQAFDMERFSLR